MGTWIVFEIGSKWLVQLGNKMMGKKGKNH
jgi:hypothetical protein